jgi:two-component system, chemotaxis family, response regulator PixG
MHTQAKTSTAGERSFQDLVAQLKEIEEISFSGNLIIQIPSIQNWMLSFSSGYLSQIHGGIDPENRWQRNLEIAYLDLPLDTSVKQSSQKESKNTNTVAQHSATLEVLFDIIQYVQHNNNQLSYQLIPIKNYQLRANSSLPLLRTRSTLAQALFNWQEWNKAGLSDYLPAKFVHIYSSESVFSSTKDLRLQKVLLSIDGDRSLRDLAICHHQHILEFTKPLLPLIQENIIFFSELASCDSTGFNSSSEEDLHEQLISVNIEPELLGKSTNNNLLAEHKPLIACIDDNLLVCENLEKTLADLGCRSFSVQDPYQIIPSLIKNKPDLIFLDLIMPVINGYEICERIRKISVLKNVPIIILSSRDGSFERERAQLSGANGFLGKPIKSTSVLEILNKYVQMATK